MERGDFLIFVNERESCSLLLRNRKTLLLWHLPCWSWRRTQLKHHHKNVLITKALCHNCKKIMIWIGANWLTHVHVFLNSRVCKKSDILILSTVAYKPHFLDTCSWSTFLPPAIYPLKTRTRGSSTTNVMASLILNTPETFVCHNFMFNSSHSNCYFWWMLLETIIPQEPQTLARFKSRTSNVLAFPTAATSGKAPDAFVHRSCTFRFGKVFMIKKIHVAICQSKPQKEDKGASSMINVMALRSNYCINSYSYFRSLSCWLSLWREVRVHIIHDQILSIPSATHAQCGGGWHFTLTATLEYINSADASVHKPRADHYPHGHSIFWKVVHDQNTDSPMTSPESSEPSGLPSPWPYLL